MKLVMQKCHKTELDWIPAHGNLLYNHVLAFEAIVGKEGVNFEISYAYN